MEKVAFLVEKTGERIPCLLNPNSLVVRRLAGVRSRQSSNGPLTGAGLKDDPLLYTGGGLTEILLDLLFDVSLVDANSSIEDVRDMTAPLTQLAEGAEGDDGYGAPPLVRFVWGKAWNIPGVVAAVAERLEYFNSSGVPRRSWLRMRLVRAGGTAAAEAAAPIDALVISDLPNVTDVAPEELRFHQLKGAGEEAGEDEGGGSSERLDEIAALHYGDPAWWRVIAAFNGIQNPWEIAPGQLLMIPPDSSVDDNESALATIPRLDVELGGASLPDNAAAVLEEVRVQHRLSQPSLCELTFFCTAQPLSELEDISIGSGLRVKTAPGFGLLFTGEVTAVEHAYTPDHGHTVQVRGYDRLHRLRKQQPVSVHVQVTPADLAREMVAELGVVVEAEQDGPSSQRLIQYRQSNLDLLVDVAQRVGLYLTTGRCAAPGYSGRHRGDSGAGAGQEAAGSQN